MAWALVFQFVKLIRIFRNTLDYISCTCFWPRPPPRNTHKYSEKYLGKHLFWASTPSELARSPQCRISAEQGFAQIAFLLSRYLYFSFLAHHPICFLGCLILTKPGKVTKTSTQFRARSTLNTLDLILTLDLKKGLNT